MTDQFDKGMIPMTRDESIQEPKACVGKVV